MVLSFYHLIALTIGFALDLIVGDPRSLPHPVRLIGRLIAALERALYPRPGKRSPRRERVAGAILCATVVLVSGGVALAVTVGAYRLNPAFGVLVEAVLTCYLLAARDLRDESMKVYDALRLGTLDKALAALSMIVGRDVESLDEAGATRAAVETVAENASDGVIAPLLYALVGGPALGYVYKAVNTLDSMVGYHNERYENFGKASARLDDVLNWIPSRIAAAAMILAAFIAGRDYSGWGAIRIFLRDRRNHKSPNSAQTESVCAGALGVRLGGDAYYFGRLVAKPTIGDALREIRPRDIPRACRLMFYAEGICMALGAAGFEAVRAAFGGR